MRETAGNDSEAMERYRRYIQRAVSCVSKTAVLYVGMAPLAEDRSRVSLACYEDPIRLDTVDGPTLSLMIMQHGRLVDDERDERRGERRVTTLRYRYAIYTNPEASGEPAIYWHWDADTGRDPHLHTHVPDPWGRGIRLHVPTGPRRVSIEQVIRTLIDEWNVVPCRDDWDGSLTDGQARYDAFRMRDRDSASD